MASSGPTDHQHVVARNIRMLMEKRAESDRAKGVALRLADAITAFAGSMSCIYLHVALFGGWIVVNTGLVPWVRPFDPFPFVMLAMWASVEAIFLSTFILISQNRMAEISERRADLDLQISLLAEHELTRLIALTDQIARHIGVEPAADTEAWKQDVEPDEVLRQIEQTEKSFEP